MFSAAGYEADDVLATLASRLQGQNQSALIVSGDRDLLQLVGAGTAVLFVGGRGKAHVHYDTASRVEQRFGVKAQQLPSLAALVGDASDNLPGVPGIGPKIGATLVNRYGDVPGILRNLDAIEPARVREALAQHREQLLLNEELTRLCTDVPLGNGPSWAPITRRLIERLRVMFETLEFQSLLARLDQIQVVDDAGIQNR
jgi:DNA polymerase-1